MSRDHGPIACVGQKDAVVPPSAANAYARCLQGAKQLLLEGCGHRPEIERREPFVDAVRRFFGS